MNYLMTVLGAIALIAIIVFSLQNLGAIDVRFLFWTMSMSKVVVIIGSYLLGMVSGWGLLHLIKHAAAK